MQADLDTSHAEFGAHSVDRFSLEHAQLGKLRHCTLHWKPSKGSLASWTINKVIVKQLQDGHVMCPPDTFFFGKTLRRSAASRNNEAQDSDAPLEATVRSVNVSEEETLLQLHTITLHGKDGSGALFG